MRPVENIEVKLCETFSRFLSGCGGQTYTAKTDKDGDFVITNVPPKEYQGLTVRVFDTDSYVFATTGVAGIAAAKYNVVAGQDALRQPDAFVQRRYEGCKSEGWINRERAGSGAQVGCLSGCGVLQVHSLS